MNVIKIEFNIEGAVVISYCFFLAVGFANRANLKGQIANTFLS